VEGGLIGAFTFAFRGRAAGVALVDVRAARDGGESVGGRIDLVKNVSYVGVQSVILQVSESVSRKCRVVSFWAGSV